MWSTCDGIGAVWTQQTAGAPWSGVSQPAMVALFDGTASGGTQSTATILLYPAYSQLIFSSTNGGSSWTQLGVAPWTYRTTAKFVSDAESNVYLVGGFNYGSTAADDTTALGTQSLNDVWFSNNKGASWYQMPTSTSSQYGYTSPVQPSSFMYSCAFINYASGSGPQGYHRQLTVMSGWQQVYSSQLSFGGLSTYSSSTFTYSQCMCDEITGVRALVADLVFPGESISSSSGSSGSGGSKSFSSGQTAGIAIGVGVGCAVLTALVALCLIGGFGGFLGGKKSSASDSNEHTASNGRDTNGSHRLEEESQSPGVEMEEGQAS